MPTAITGVVAAAVTGVVSALITRALMRAVALVVNDDPSFTPGALVAIVVIYTLLLVPGCVALSYSSAPWAWILFGLGIAVLASQAVAIGVAETANGHGMTPVRWILLVL